LAQEEGCCSGFATSLPLASNAAAMAPTTAGPGTPEGLPTLLTLLASRPARSAEPKTPRRPFACAEIELLEEIEASTPRLELFCKNTFLTAAEPMSPSLRPFYLERRVQTCPGARAGCLQGLFDEGYRTPLTASPAAEVPPTPCYWGGAGPVAALSLADVLAPPPSVPPSMKEDTWGSVERLTVRVLSQALPRSAALSETPASGVPPSVGSALHGTGKCKPCAFLYTRGCGHGTQCEFCHSCGEGERKRRKQAKAEFLKATRKQRQPKQ